MSLVGQVSCSKALKKKQTERNLLNASVGGSCYERGDDDIGMWHLPYLAKGIFCCCLFVFKSSRPGVFRGARKICWFHTHAFFHEEINAGFNHLFPCLLTGLWQEPEL